MPAACYIGRRTYSRYENNGKPEACTGYYWETWDGKMILWTVFTIDYGDIRRDYPAITYTVTQVGVGGTDEIFARCSAADAA